MCLLHLHSIRSHKFLCDCYTVPPPTLQFTIQNYTEVGYKKMKAPSATFQMISDFWQLNKSTQTPEDWSIGSIFVNYWKSPTQSVRATQVHESIWNETAAIVSEWTGQEMVESSVDGIRVYSEGSMVATHVDGVPVLASAMINVAQDLDEGWPLEFIGHDGVARNVTMEPGDMVLYESHSVLHGRPFELKGRYAAYLFLYFVPLPTEEQLKENALPPYILKESTLAKAWEEGVYDNIIPGSPKAHWGQHEAHDAAGDGDLEALIRIAQNDIHSLHAKDNNGWEPIHEAVRAGNEAVIEFLHAQGADLNALTHSSSGKGLSVLDIALDFWDHDSSFISWLRSLGATVTNNNDIAAEL